MVGAESHVGRFFVRVGCGAAAGRCGGCRHHHRASRRRGLRPMLAMPTTRAARRAAARHSSSYRRTCWASCSTATARPRHRSRVDVSCALRCRSSRSRSAVLRRGHASTAAVMSALRAPNDCIITGSNKATVNWVASARGGPSSARKSLMAVAVLPGGARLSAARATAPRSCGRRGPRAYLRMDGRYYVAALPDGMHFVVSRLRHSRARSGCTSTARSSTPSRAHRRGGRGGDGRPAHHRRRERQLVKVWSVATKSLESTWKGGTPLRGGGDARRPALLSGSGDQTIVWRLNGALENTFKLHTGTVFALVALPDNQHALRLARQHRQALQRHDGAVLRTFRATHAVTSRCPAARRCRRRFDSPLVERDTRQVIAPSRPRAAGQAFPRCCATVSRVDLLIAKNMRCTRLPLSLRFLPLSHARRVGIPVTTTSSPSCAVSTSSSRAGAASPAAAPPPPFSPPSPTPRRGGRPGEGGRERQQRDRRRCRGRTRR